MNTNINKDAPILRVNIKKVMNAITANWKALESIATLIGLDNDDMYVIDAIEEVALASVVYVEKQRAEEKDVDTFLELLIERMQKPIREDRFCKEYFELHYTLPEPPSARRKPEDVDPRIFIRDLLMLDNTLLVKWYIWDGRVWHLMEEIRK